VVIWRRKWPCFLIRIPNTFDGGEREGCLEKMMLSPYVGGQVLVVSNGGDLRCDLREEEVEEGDEKGRRDTAGDEGIEE